MEEPDPRTIRAAADGDRDAFDELVRAYQVPVWRFLRHLVGDPGLAEDVAQEAFLRVHRRLATFAFRSKFSTWLFQIARNAAIDALRARERRSRLLAALPVPQQAAGPAEAFEITSALASLTPRLREAFIFVEVLGFTYREAGETLGAPEGTVKSRVARARGLLVTWMQADSTTGGRDAGAL